VKRPAAWFRTWSASAQARTPTLPLPSTDFIAHRLRRRLISHRRKKMS
jgi:hypothetical protein